MACRVGCDSGPQEDICGEPLFATCCNDQGHCIANELIPPDDQETLSATECSEGLLCVPDRFRDQPFEAEQCDGNLLLAGPYRGVCLPNCLDIPLDILIGRGSCSSRDDDCVPCQNPLTQQPTGAPGCPAP
jgi:hypothetical protein